MGDPLTRLLVLGHLAATLYMAGVIWFVQVVHYPLFAEAGAAAFPAYGREHTRRTGWVVAPPMLAELATAAALAWARPAGVPAWQPVAGLGLLAVLWASTWAIQIPCHNRLSCGFDPAAHRRLVATNWVRTAGWSLRAALALWITWNAVA